MARVLIVEDNDDYSFALSTLLQACGEQVVVTHDARSARAAIHDADDPFAVALVDLGLPDADGLHLLDEISHIDPMLPVVCLTGRSEPAMVVQAMRRGAVDYLTKPAAKAVLLPAVRQAAATSASRRAAAGTGLPRPVGSSPSWKAAMRLVSAAATATRTTVLFTGEPGVGKEVAASLLHELGPRAKKPLVTANAACFSPGLMESELFGHEAGAFTGAAKRRRGLFEQAHGGTLFLDEIGELPLELQSKLLRVLEGHPFRRVGGEELVDVDVRFVSATNRSLETMVRDGRFRADLYERIRVFEVKLPPLRERRDDIAPLAHHFIAHLAHRAGRRDDVGLPELLPETLDLLERWEWPGNVRELRNVIERALILAGGGRIAPHHLPDHLRSTSTMATFGSVPVGVGAATVTTATATATDGVDGSLERLTRSHIESVFHEMGGNVTRTALVLGVSRLTLRKRLQAWGLRPVKG